jgi:hypothetical protein
MSGADLNRYRNATSFASPPHATHEHTSSTSTEDLGRYVNATSFVSPRENTSITHQTTISQVSNPQSSYELSDPELRRYVNATSSLTAQLRLMTPLPTHIHDTSVYRQDGNVINSAQSILDVVSPKYAPQSVQKVSTGVVSHPKYVQHKNNTSWREDDDLSGMAPAAATSINRRREADVIYKANKHTSPFNTTSSNNNNNTNTSSFNNIYPTRTTTSPFTPTHTTNSASTSTSTSATSTSPRPLSLQELRQRRVATLAELSAAGVTPSEAAQQALRAYAYGYHRAGTQTHSGTESHADTDTQTERHHGVDQGHGHGHGHVLPVGVLLRPRMVRTLLQIRALQQQQQQQLEKQQASSSTEVRYLDTTSNKWTQTPGPNWPRENALRASSKL